MPEAVAKKLEVSKKGLTGKKKGRTVSPELASLSKAVYLARKGTELLTKVEPMRKNCVNKFVDVVNIAKSVGAYTTDEANEIIESLEKASPKEIEYLAETIIKHILYKKTMR